METAVAAPPERVWAVMSDVARWPEWTTSVRSATPLQPGPLDVGSRVRVAQPRLPAAVWEVVELEPGRGFTWVNRSPGLVSTGVHRIEPDAVGSRVLLEIRQEGPLSVVARLFRSLTVEYVQREADGLKARSEAGTSA